MTAAGRAKPAEDTICALASAPGAGQRAVLRLSGPASAELVRATCRRAGAAFAPGARGAFDVELDDGVGAQPALLLWMPGPGSYTREDVAELHLPGNPFLAQAALARLVAAGARSARPGEFTQRAFLNGRLDLTRAEGVLALVHAANDAERRAATSLLFGGLEERLAGLREGLETLRALCEASLDFDESDTGHVPTAELLRLVAEVRDGLDEALSWEAARTPDGALPRVVLAGPPNAGKSSLFNALVAGGQAALVHPEAGATRDFLTGEWELGGGLRARLVDTAGEMDARSPVEAEAQQLARTQRAAADLVLWVVDARDPVSPPEALRDGAAALGIWNQLDADGAGAVPEEGDWTWIGTSAVEGRGLDELRQAVRTRLGRGPTLGSPRELYVRHRDALARAAQHLAQAELGLRHGALPLDLVAEMLREGTDALDAIGGRTTPEDLLDRIFARFCLGK